jgi:hypothetical protein
MFVWQGQTLPLFDHPYNQTSANERAVELPIVRVWTDPTIPDSARLEVGNVLGHYPGLSHNGMVVDRHEIAPGVTNVDVFDLGTEVSPCGLFDEIISVSTLEHVRWDEVPREAGGSVAAIHHLQSLLAPGGRMLITIPTGWNQPLDEWLAADRTGATYVRTIRRQGSGWVEIEGPLILPYAFSTQWAEAVWIGEFYG